MATSTIQTQIELLWTNPSPTVGFSGTTLNIDVSEYKFLIVVTNWFAAGTLNEITTHIISVGLRNVITAGKDVNGQRIFDLTNPSQIVISDGNQYTLNTISYSTENRRLAPMRIYGIR